ncbi:VOC family protein, partial [bacterium]|nr:VOC family protein [bacterium]
SRIVHFELPSTNFAASVKFYENVLGWRIEKYEGPMEYYMVYTGENNEPGINGAIGGPAIDYKGTVNTADVANIDETLKKVVANGGKIVIPKQEIPNVGVVAYIQEPGGAILGVIQQFPNAGM